MGHYHAMTEIIEFMAKTGGRWVRISELADKTGVTDLDDFKAAVVELHFSDLILADRDPLNHRITRREKALAPTIGGEPMHVVMWRG